MADFKRTLCASCELMWDGFGDPCPRKECSTDTTKCSGYKRMSDNDLMTLAPKFWNTTFCKRLYSEEEAKRYGVMWEWQPVRPLLSEIEPKQLTIF